MLPLPPRRPSDQLEARRAININAKRFAAAAIARLATNDAAVAKGVPPGRIAVGGFSMGGNLAYQTAARYHADASKPPLEEFLSRFLGS